MANYNGQQKDWPHFKFSLTGVEGELLTFSEKVGRRRKRQDWSSNRLKKRSARMK